MWSLHVLGLPTWNVSGDSEQGFDDMRLSNTQLTEASRQSSPRQKSNGYLRSPCWKNMYDNNPLQIIGPWKEELKGCLGKEPLVQCRNSRLPPHGFGALSQPHRTHLPRACQGGWDPPQRQPLGGLLAVLASPERSTHSSGATFAHDV